MSRLSIPQDTAKDDSLYGDAIARTSLAALPLMGRTMVITKEKLQALEQLVLEQVEGQHREESTSPWSSPVFVVKKKSGAGSSGARL